MEQARPVRCLAAVLSLLLVLSPLPSSAQLCAPSSAEPFIDNRDGYFVNYEEPPIHPLQLSYNNRRLYAANIPAGEVSVFDITAPGDPRLIGGIPVGLGPVSLRRRPPQAPLVEPPSPLPLPLKASASAGVESVAGAFEVQPVPIERQLWVVCMSSNAIFIIDEESLQVIDAIYLPDRPADVVFDASGKTAYVSLSDSNQIAVLDADDPHAAPATIEFETEMPFGGGVRVHVEEPRNLLRDGDSLYGLSFLSGNGSSAVDLSLIDPFIGQHWDFWPANPEPPDRDVLRVDLASGSPSAASTAMWRAGTLNFDLALGAGGELWVSSLEMRNVDPLLGGLEGEPHYQQEAFALHTVSHAAASTTGAPALTAVTIDLNDPANHAAGLHSSFRCAMPNDLHFNAARDRLFVACGDSRGVALLNATTDQVIAEFKVTSGRRGFGIRGVALDRNERWLYAYGRGDNTLLVFDTANLIAGGPKPPSRIVSLGWDITPANVINGRFHFLDAANSNDGLSTCNTCHVDGHLDGIAWDLSDFTGDVANTPNDVPRTPKGAKVTMSLLGIEETPPFHWRGDRADLDAFNPAFEGLLGGAMLGETEGGELDDFLDFVFTLSYPPNPNQELDRSYTPAARLGFDCFEAEDAHIVSADTSGTPLSVSCEDCHSMAGASGTLNQVNNPVTLPVLADDATQLRGLWDKVSDTVDYDPVITCPGEFLCGAFVNRLPATGWGVANTGFVDSILDFVSLNAFSELPDGSEDEITRFIVEMDTGSAPTTAAVHQLDGTLAGSPTLPSPLAELVAGTSTALPANDLIARGWIRVQGSPRSIGLLYDPGASPEPVFVSDTVDNVAAGCTPDASVVPGAAGLGPFTLAQLDAMVASRDAVLTVIGTPVGSGYRLALDRDMDCLRDGDEVAHGTVTDDPDFDGDGYPDGYEVRLGSDPLVADTPTDGTAPLVPVGGSTIAWKNSNVMKVRWETDEESVSRIRVFDTTGTTPVLAYAKTEEQFKRRHVMVARKLEPNRSYAVEVETEDPLGNRQTFPVGSDTMQDHLFDSVHIAETTLTHVGPASTPGLERYEVSFRLVREDGTAAAGATVPFTLVEWVPGVPANQSTEVTGPSDSSGVATFAFDGTLDFESQGGFAETFATDVLGAPDDRLYFHSLDGQCGHWDQLGLNGATASHPCL